MRGGLDQLEQQSIFIIREAFAQFKDVAMLWSMGKDSTTLLWLAKKAFPDKLPFPVIHIDTTFKFPEMYAFRDKLAKDWNLDLKICKNEEALAKGMGYATHDAVTCCHELKTIALQQAMAKSNFKALFVGIRRDEHGIRGKERIFSPRDKEFKWDYLNQQAEIWDLFAASTEDGNHVRVHPLLQWSEMNIWEYTKRENIPVNPLYFAKNGKRYRSLGCMPITHPIESNADTVDKIIEELKKSKSAERAGRAQDKEREHAMQKLRSLGYM